VEQLGQPLRQLEQKRAGLANPGFYIVIRKSVDPLRVVTPGGRYLNKHTINE
jgi:hypothetical protein